MIKYKQMRLREYCQIYGQAEVAKQRGITPGAVSNALTAGRNIWLAVDDIGRIKKRGGVVEHKPPVNIW